MFALKDYLTQPLVIPALLALAIGACASPDRHADSSLSFVVPTSWSDSSVKTGNDTLMQWWTRFNDPLLNTLVTQSLSHNLNVKSAQSILRQAWALRDIAAAALLPALDGSVTAQHNRATNNSSNLFQLGVNGSWNPDVFGAARSARNAAEASALSSNASLADTQVAISAEVGLTYITLRLAQLRLDIASKNLANQEETLQIASWRQQAGILTELEVDQARAAVEQTRSLLPALQMTIGQNQHALALLTAQPPAALDLMLLAVQPVPVADADLAVTIPAETLRQRADVRAAEYNVMAAQDRVSQAEAARLPNFSLGGSIGLSALTTGMLSNGASVVSSLIAGVTLPIFDGGARRAQISLQQAAEDQAHLAYETAVLTALSEVENALLALRQDRERLNSLRIAGSSAASASQLARQRYSSGLVDFQVVLQTQLTQLSTEDNVALASASVSTDQIRLYKALGGGWNSGNPGDRVNDATENTTTNPGSR